MNKDQDKNPENIDDVVYEDELNSDSSDSKIKKLKAQLKKVEAEKQEYLDGWQRSKADFINFRKQQEKERADFLKYASEEFISELIPVLDSFEMAFKDKTAWEKAPENWRMGVEYIHSQLINILELRGVSVIYPLNEQFDPQKHNSVDNIETEDKDKDGVILEVILKGYNINGKVVRPPSVKIGKAI